MPVDSRWTVVGPVDPGPMDQVGDGGSGTAVGLLADVPGRDLQAAIAAIDLRDLCGADVALVIRAQARCLAWLQASMAATIHEFVHCPAWARDASARVERVQEFACDELALLLHVAPMTGKKMVLKAVDLVERHPKLWTALSDGLIDNRKVTVITEMAPESDDALAAAADDVLLSTAARADGSTALEQTVAETPGMLKLRTQRVLSALDPTWTRAVRREALTRRRFVRGPYGPGIGIGFLGLYDIDIASMAAAYEHVDAIARGIKHLGDDRPIDQVRVDTAVDLLTGGNLSTTAAAGADDERADGDAAEAPESAHAGSGPAQKSTADPSERDPDGPGIAGPEPAEPADDIVAEQAPTPRAMSARSRADVDLVVHINMLADLVDAMRQGVLVEVAGFGLVPADVAARLVKAAAARPSHWCMTIVDDTGRVVEHVRTTHDPTTAMRNFVNARDRHCRFPGCIITAVRCDTDHTTAWETGGPTCPCNMAPLCRRHHRLKQAQGFNLTIDTATNNARWTTPHTDGATSPPWTSTGRDSPPPF
jgi:hypothetical protein